MCIEVVRKLREMLLNVCMKHLVFHISCKILRHIMKHVRLFYGAYYSWRLFMLTGNPMYLDVMEKAFYNNLSSMGLDGKSYFYTNVLRWYGKQHPLLSLDFHQRWTEECTCVCCPTSLVRFLAEKKRLCLCER